MASPPPSADEYEPLSGNAERIISALLTATFPGRDEVARQVAVARARRIDVDGSLKLSVGEAPPAPVVQRVPVEAEAEDIDGVTVHVLLHVIDGYIDELEIYRDDSAPLRGTIRPEALSIIVL